MYYLGKLKIKHLVGICRFEMYSITNWVVLYNIVYVLCYVT